MLCTSTCARFCLGQGPRETITISIYAIAHTAKHLTPKTGWSPPPQQQPQPQQQQEQQDHLNYGSKINSGTDLDDGYPTHQMYQQQQSHPAQPTHSLQQQQSHMMPNYAAMYTGAGYGQGYGSGSGSTDSNDLLIQKLNYMINLLEQSQDERTNNVTEEIVLYSFLGIFIIFIVDSFVRVGKYVR